MNQGRVGDLVVTLALSPEGKNYVTVALLDVAIKPGKEELAMRIRKELRELTYEALYELTLIHYDLTPEQLDVVLSHVDYMGTRLVEDNQWKAEKAPLFKHEILQNLVIRAQYFHLHKLPKFFLCRSPMSLGPLN